MAKVCKKCGYERKPDDTAPDYECPHCGAVYAKVEAQLARIAKEDVTAQKEPPRHKFELKAGPAIKRTLSFLLIVIAWIFGAAGILNLLVGDFRLAAFTLPALIVAVPPLRKLLPSKAHAPIIGLLIIGIAGDGLYRKHSRK